jgi:uncharacterized repeat protein (TIGR03803 family)
LVLTANGNAYGVTSEGGSGISPFGYAGGTIFQVAPDGTFTTLYNFCSKVSAMECTDGSGPSELIQASDGNLYGTAAIGGAGVISSVYTNGTIFEITPDGGLTTLYEFCEQSGCPDGFSPNGVIQDTDGEFYGTTRLGGAGFNDLLPPTEPILSSISTATIGAGANGTFTLTGVNTNFVEGVTTVAAIPGITIGTVTVTSPTSLTVRLAAGISVVQQPVSVVAITGVPPGNEEAVLPNGLVIQ